MKKISKELQAMEKFLERMDSGELVTPLRLFFVLIVSASMITAISFSVSPDERFHLEDEEEYVANLSSKPFVYNFHEAMKMREENLEFYNYPSHQWFIEKRSGLSLEEFWDLYDSKWPVVVTDAADSWPAIKWTKDFFLKKYSNDTVMVKVNLNGVKSVQPFLFKHFIDQLDNFYERSDSWVYMEDELFIVRRPELQKDIGINKYSEDNFFSLFPEEIKPWDCLLLWGTRYSRSSLHMDPYNWTATSAVLSGQKLWKLFPPGQDHLLYIHPKRNCNFPLECKKYDSPIDAFNPDFKMYPRFKDANYITVEVQAGEMLIIPTGWYHQAYNNEETMSISSQLMNRNNYLVVLEEIIKGGNIKRKKLPVHFHTLLPPDQVKLFLSLLDKKILQHGKEITGNVLKDMSKLKKK